MTKYLGAIDVRLRDKRSYIRAADLYGLLVMHARRARAEITADLRMDFSRVSTRSLQIVISREQDLAIARDVPFTFSFLSEGHPTQGYFVELADEVTDRYAGNDDAIYKQLHVNGDELTIDDPAGDFEPIDVVAALSAKHELLEPATDGRKWLVARLELAAPLPQQQTQVFQSRIERRLGTTRIRSLLLIDGQKIGRVVLVQGVA